MYINKIDMYKSQCFPLTNIFQLSVLFIGGYPLCWKTFDCAEVGKLTSKFILLVPACLRETKAADTTSYGSLI
jgi:hypothetical protein